MNRDARHWMLWCVGLIVGMTLLVIAFLMSNLSETKQLSFEVNDTVSVDESHPKPMGPDRPRAERRREGSATVKEDQPISTSETRQELDRELNAYLKPDEGIVFLDSYVSERLSRAQLPELYRVLRDETFARSWGKALFAICVLEDGDTSVSAVREFVSTPWDWRSSSYTEPEARYIIRGMMGAFANLAMAGAKSGGPLLREAFTHEGAIALLEDWRNVPLPDGLSFEDVLVADIRYAAASGLLHTRSPELFEVVEEEILKLRSASSLTLEESAVLSSCRLIVGERYLYETMGWEEGVQYLYGLEGEERLLLITKSLARYEEKAGQGGGTER